MRFLGMVAVDFLIETNSTLLEKINGQITFSTLCFIFNEQIPFNLENSLSLYYLSG
jgi:hypothetical protein